MKLLLIRFSVLWIWIITIFISIAVYLYKGTTTKMETGEILDNLSTVFALIIPQVTIIFTFFFKDSGNRQSEQVNQNPSLAYLSLIFSLIYHISFWFFLWFGIIEEKLGDTMNANTISILHLIGLISILDLSPVGFLFSSKVKDA